MRLLPTLLVSLALLTAAPPAIAAQEKKDPLQVSGSVGWNGRVVPGDWAPVRIDLDNRGRKDANLIIAVTWAGNFGTQSTPNPSFDGTEFYGRTGPALRIALTLPALSRKRLSVSLLVPDTPQISVWAFALDAETGRTLARGELMTKSLDRQKKLVGIVGSTKPDAIDSDSVESAVLSADELPEDWQGYSSLAALVWLDGKATELRSSAQAEALRQWISSGGRFFLARGNALNLGGTPIAELLPVKLGATREVTFSGHDRVPDGKTVILESSLRSGVVRSVADGLPLVVETGRDAGRVTFVAFDPTRDSFAASDKARAFWKWLLKLPSQAASPEDYSVIRAPAIIGSLALAEQAGRFPDIAPPEIGGLFMLILLYLAVVGPFDYFVLRKLRKLEYTWFTFPAYVVLFTFFILFVGGAFIQGEGYQREIRIIDHYPDTGFVRRRALSAVLAPSDTLYRCEDAQPVSSNYIQKYRVFEVGAAMTDIRLLLTPQRAAENWRINRKFTGLALADRCETAPSPLTYTITAQDSVGIQIRVKNTTDQTYEGSGLVTPRGVYWISAIPPGESLISGSRIAATVEDYVRAEGVQHNSRERADYGEEYGYPTQMTESILTPLVRRALIGASFPLAAAESKAPQTGFARSLEATSWLINGGSVLFAWPKDAGVVVRFDPNPARQTSVSLLRFFQGPPP